MAESTGASRGPVLTHYLPVALVDLEVAASGPARVLRGQHAEGTRLRVDSARHNGRFFPKNGAFRGRVKKRVGRREEGRARADVHLGHLAQRKVRPDVVPAHGRGAAGRGTARVCTRTPVTGCCQARQARQHHAQVARARVVLRLCAIHWRNRPPERSGPCIPAWAMPWASERVLGVQVAAHPRTVFCGVLSPPL